MENSNQFNYGYNFAKEELALSNTPDETLKNIKDFVYSSHDHFDLGAAAYVKEYEVLTLTTAKERHAS